MAHRRALVLLGMAAIAVLWGAREGSALGSMSSIAVAYGDGGSVFCGLALEGSHQVTCSGSDESIVFGAPTRLPFLGLTAGDGFVCGLLMDSRQPYCWGDNAFVKLGVPQPMDQGAAYAEISAGDHHLCGLRAASPTVDCWGYNMTSSQTFPAAVGSLTAGSSFNCVLLQKTVSCWGDETGNEVNSLAPSEFKFRAVYAGGFHVCGVAESSSLVSCWGKSLSSETVSPAANLVDFSANGGGVDSPPSFPMVSVVGGRFHACGIRSSDRRAVCWGFRLVNSAPPPAPPVKVLAMAAGDYFTCGVVGEASLKPLCWGAGFPSSVPMAVSPGLCIATPACDQGTFEFTRQRLALCNSPDSRVCLPCSTACPEGSFVSAACTPKSDRVCQSNCTACGPRPGRPALQTPIFIAELAFGAALALSLTLAGFGFLFLRRRPRPKPEPKTPDGVADRRTGWARELKTSRARVFSYEELARATGGFGEAAQIGKGSFSCVFKGVLKDGTTVAVKRAVSAPDRKKNSREFRTELDLLSRLNHAHLLTLLGFCEEAGERLLVYEFMAHGSLHQHLHGPDPRLKPRLDWVRRVTIAVQAARGIEYLHGYACPPVIHRDIKSSNILIDEEHNARVADFGLSLLGPADSASPLSELPAGTLGYLDPEYYRLHYLTTKSDVYSFGVLLLEILSGRRAIDLGYEEGNIVEWAVPLIRAGEVGRVLDPALSPPAQMEALRRIARVACKCVRMKGKERPSMDEVTTALERALALLMGGPCEDHQPILPTEVVLGSSRLHKKPSQRSSSRAETELPDPDEPARSELRAPSWITVPSLASSHRRKSSSSNDDGDGGADGLKRLDEEIGPASPQEDLFLQHNF
ncbi:crinkly4 [Wolffia australiana]